MSAVPGSTSASMCESVNILRLDRASKAVRADKSTVLAAVSLDGLSLQFAMQELRMDPEVVLCAVIQNPISLVHAGKDLQRIGLRSHVDGLLTSRTSLLMMMSTLRFKTARSLYKLNSHGYHVTQLFKRLIAAFAGAPLGVTLTRIPSQVFLRNTKPFVPVFKLVITGCGGVGKSTFIKRHISGEFESRYVATIGPQLHSLQFETSRGLVVFDVWDTASSEPHSFFRQAQYMTAECAIIMFDVTSRITYKNVPQFYRDIDGVCDSIPIVLVGNKIDLQEHRKVKRQHVTFHRKKSLQYFELSTKNFHSFEKPFLWLARKLCGDDELRFIGPTAMCPPSAAAGLDFQDPSAFTIIPLPD